MWETGSEGGEGEPRRSEQTGLQATSADDGMKARSDQCQSRSGGVSKLAEPCKVDVRETLRQEHLLSGIPVVFLALPRFLAVLA